jgi:hypothetical protein
MNKFWKSCAIGLLSISVWGCGGLGGDDSDSGPVETGQRDAQGRVILEGNITATRRLLSTEKYILRGFVRVRAGAELQIDPGTVIFGEKASQGTLIIERGGRINAAGTSDRPIVFTSAERPGQRNYGDWGGLVVLGSAPTNKPTTTLVEGVPDGQYGGTNADDNSGVLRYVRIEFSGIPITPGNEINGLTMGGVGRGTTIEYVQVSFCGDDSYEWFGGNVNCRYLIAHRGWDDDFDADFGYSGRVQFGVALRDPVINDSQTSNGFESDNDANGTTEQPFTASVFSNMSVFGPFARPGVTAFGNEAQWGRAAHLRRNTEISIFNAVFTGWSEGLRLDGANTQAKAASGALDLQVNFHAGHRRNLNVANGAVQADLETFFNTPARGNRVLADVAAMGLNAQNFSLTAPNFLPASGSPLLTGATFASPRLQGGFFQTVTHVGAFGTTDWTRGWANFDPQNTVY